MCCDRECQFCIDRNHECAENGTRIGGCMSFRPDTSIPEVAEAESKSANNHKREYIACPKCGGRVRPEHAGLLCDECARPDDYYARLALQRE